MASDLGDQDHCDRREPLMKWAVRADESHRAVHVGMLTPKENGLACRCLCYACGDRLRAINVDKPESHFKKRGTQQLHFKHESGADRRCLSAVSRMIALQLFVEQDEIYLPPRRRPARRELPTGYIVDDEAETPGDTVQVSERQWIDDQSAVLVLTDGRELVVTVRTTHTLGSEGPSRSVLSFAGLDNPEVAGWTREKILEHLRLPNWARWDRHWNDEALDSEAEEKLGNQEDLYLSDIPREWLNGLEGKMASETILHWVIKRAIQSSRRLKVPGVRKRVTQPMPDGTIAEDIAECPAHTLELQGVLFERRLGNIVPDVICWARKAGSSEPPYQLLVEAAVTHYVNDEKRERIVQSGLACIEIRADLFMQAGSIPVKEIERVVCSDEAVKDWIVHPHLVSAIEKARNRLAEQARFIQRRMDEAEAKERKKKEDRDTLDKWYREAPDAALAKGYLKALLATWRGHERPTIGEIKVELDDLWRAANKRGLAKGNRHGLESKDGALNLVRRIAALNGRRHTDRAVEIAVEASRVRWQDAPHAVLALFALNTYHHPDALNANADFRALESQIHTSLSRGDSMFVRTMDFDPILRLLFPDMAERLASPFGTRSALEALLAEKAAIEAHAHTVAQRRRRRKEAVANGRAKREKQQIRDALTAEIDLCASKTRWARTISGAEEAGPLYGLYGGRVRLKGIDTMLVIKSALEHKGRGQSIKAMLMTLPFETDADVRKSLKMLHLARICIVTDESLLLD